MNYKIMILFLLPCLAISGQDYSLINYESSESSKSSSDKSFQLIGATLGGALVGLLVGIPITEDDRKTRKAIRDMTDGWGDELQEVRENALDNINEDIRQKYLASTLIGAGSGFVIGVVSVLKYTGYIAPREDSFFHKHNLMIGYDFLRNGITMTKSF